MEMHSLLCSILKMSLKWQEEEQQQTSGKSWKKTRGEVELTRNINKILEAGKHI